MMKHRRDGSSWKCGTRIKNYINVLEKKLPNWGVKGDSETNLECLENYK